MAQPRLSQQHRQRIFDELLESCEELRAYGAVDDPVVASERAAHHGCDRKRAVLDDRPLFARADRQNSAMRRVDHANR